MKYVDADKIAVALGKMPTWPDFDVRGEIGDARGADGDAPYYVCCCRIPNCTGIIQRDRATIVTWDDNTKTTIVAEKGFDENEHMLFDAFCIAFTKKMLGSTTNILRTIEANDTDTINKRKKEFEEQIKKTMREANEQQEKARFEAAVQAKMYEDRVIEEAIRRIQIRNERKTNNDET